MPKGMYIRTEKHLKQIKQLGKSIETRERCRVLGRRTGKINITSYNTSELGRRRAQQRMIKFCETDAGKEQLRLNGNKMGPINLSTNAGMEARRKNGKKVGMKYGSINGKKNIVNLVKPTESQIILSKAITDNGIYNTSEWWFPEIRRLGDIGIPSLNLIIEVDGSSHNGMFCTKEEKQIDDKRKEDQIRSLGWEIIRVTNEEVANNLNDIVVKITKFGT